MKTALYQNRMIVLDQVDRDQYQKLFISGKNGELFCPVCNEKVRLFLGIQGFPHFFHAQSPDTHCPEPSLPPTKTENKQNDNELNGFRIPKGRTITEAPKSIDPFTPAKNIEFATPFTNFTSSINLNRSPYLQQLAENSVVLDESQTAAVLEMNGS